ncbi:MFS transporter [Streptomyces pactum]|uniref:MFS transporter n=1 Tax=Streptomyces pactum TaxID=68249 RepID=A0A1S6J1N5_9ACTN|nr:MFS transporter [Streptomyces pactum]AQS65660.1 MFS transporter [Streptomyces pactum]AQS71597.1 MFS transporter [Streptomyces pactum]
MTTGTRRVRRVLPEGYSRCLANPDFRRLQPGFLVSFLGDGMSFVAVAWLAVELAGPADRALVVGLAVAAYSLPAAIGSLTLGRWLSGRNAKSLILLNSLLRAAVFTLLPALSWLDLLDVTTYIALLALSSVLHAWGIAGRQTFVAETLPDEDRLAGHSLVGSQEQLSFIIGPPLAGLVAAALGPAAVLAGDAASYLYLAVVAARVRGDSKVGRRPAVPLRRSGQTLARHPELMGLLALTFVFYLLYGPIEVALPVFVAEEMGADPTALGWIWGAFGVGAVIGALVAGTLRRLPLWPTALAIVAGWGLAILPFAQFGTLTAGIVGFGLGGLIYAPYGPVTITLLQQKAPLEELVSLSAFRSAILVIATPLGAALGGPLVGAFGAAGTIRLSGLTTVGLAVLGALLIWLVRPRPDRGKPQPVSGRRHADRT